jgi:hypothetical protein
MSHGSELFILNEFSVSNPFLVLNELTVIFYIVI